VQGTRWASTRLIHVAGVAGACYVIRLRLMHLSREDLIGHPSMDLIRIQIDLSYHLDC
jgi:hypothetical protein